MEDLFQVAHRFERFCRHREWKFCFIGGLALQQWGRPRLTRHVDLCLLTGFGEEESFIDAILSEYIPRIEDAREFAISNRVLLLSTHDGIGIDVSLGGIPFEEKIIEHAQDIEYLPGLSLRICSAEDLVILKSFADRLQDWADVESVIDERENTLDWSYVNGELETLCALKESTDILKKLRDLRGNA